MGLGSGKRILLDCSTAGVANETSAAASANVNVNTITSHRVRDGKAWIRWCLCRKSDFLYTCIDSCYYEVPLYVVNDNMCAWCHFKTDQIPQISLRRWRWVIPKCTTGYQPWILKWSVMKGWSGFSPLTYKDLPIFVFSDFSFLFLNHNLFAVDLLYSGQHRHLQGCRVLYFSPKGSDSSK